MYIKWIMHKTCTEKFLPFVFCDYAQCLNFLIIQVENLSEQLQALHAKLGDTNQLEEQLQNQLLTQESEHNDILEQEKQKTEQLQQAIEKLKVRPKITAN